MKIHRHILKLFQKLLKNGRALSCNYGNPDGETFLTATQRIYNFLDEIAELWTNTNVLLITHKSTMRIINTYFNRQLPENDLIFDFDPSNVDIVTYGRIFKKEEIENAEYKRPVTPRDLSKAAIKYQLTQEEITYFLKIIQEKRRTKSCDERV